MRFVIALNAGDLANSGPDPSAFKAPPEPRDNVVGEAVRPGAHPEEDALDDDVDSLTGTVEEFSPAETDQQ